MTEYELIPHPDARPKASLSIRAQVSQDRTGVSVTFDLNGDVDAIARPSAAKPHRKDELWRTTCFEIFVRRVGEAYLEFNFSPSGEWAAYSFDSYRIGMRPLAVDESSLLPWPLSGWSEYGTEYGDGVLSYHVGLNLGSADAGTAFALAAVIEETDGTKSYWALAHAPGPPDFHNPACFTASLPPPARA